MDDDGWHFHTASDDAFGPGSDLVLSLLAITVLLLAVVGTDEGAGPPLPPPDDTLAIGEGRANAVPDEEIIAVIEGLKRSNSELLERLKARPERAMLNAYDLSLTHIRPALEGRIIRAEASIVAAGMEAYRERRERSPEPLALAIRTEVAPVLLGALPQSMPAGEAVGTLVSASAAVAASYQAALFEEGLPMLCASIEPGAFFDQSGLRSVMASRAEGLDRISEFQTFYRLAESRAGEEPAATLEFWVEPSGDEDCAGRF